MLSLRILLSKAQKGPVMTSDFDAGPHSVVSNREDSNDTFMMYIVLRFFNSLLDLSKRMSWRERWRKGHRKTAWNFSQNLNFWNLIHWIVYHLFDFSQTANVCSHPCSCDQVHRSFYLTPRQTPLALEGKVSTIRTAHSPCEATASFCVSLLLY